MDGDTFGDNSVGFRRMTEPSESLEARVEALESRVDELTGQLQQTKQDAVAARVLAGGADRDVDQVRGEMRDLRGEMHDFRLATMASFNAMREDLVDLRRETADGFARVDDGFSEVRARLDGTATGLTHITGLLNGLIADREND